MAGLSTFSGYKTDRWSLSPSWKDSPGNKKYKYQYCSYIQHSRDIKQTGCLYHPAIRIRLVKKNKYQYYSFIIYEIKA